VALEGAARWLIEPLPVISPRSIDGSSSSTCARATRVALPLPSRHRWAW
jgi:hypothetical protein